MKYVPSTLAALMLAAGAATALGQAPIIDGIRDAVYGAPLWINTENPTQFGDNAPGFFPCNDLGSGIQLAINNSNIGGVIGVDMGGPGVCMTSGAGVSTGIEIKIPFSAIGNPTAANIKIAGFIINGGHDFMSNQVIGGSTTCIGNLGDPRAVNFNDTTGGLAGNQFVTVANGTDTAAADPVIDGVLDAAFYGPALWVNNIETGFGDNATTSAPGECDGNEFDAIHARVVTVGGQTSLYIFIAGNLKSTFDKFWVFLDCADGAGQNRLLGNNADIDFNGLNRLGENGTMGNGLRFDDGFAADYAITGTNGGMPVTTFANFASIPTNGGGQGRFLGSAANPAPIVVNPCVPEALPVPSPDKAYGSEFDAVYGRVCDDYLYLFIAGNLEVNGNRIDLFFDVDSQSLNGGQQTLRNDNVAVDFGGLNRMGGPEVQGNGLTFDAGFLADYWVAFRNTGYGTLDPVEQAAHAAILRTSGAAGDIAGAQGLLDYGSFMFAPKATMNPLSFDGSVCVRFDGMNNCLPNGAGTTWNPTSLPGIDVQGDLTATVNTLTPVAEIFASYAPRLIGTAPFDPLGRNPGGVNVVFPDLIQATINNSNVAGVSGTTASGGDQVTTGFELRIRLDELGWDGVSPVRVCAFINSGSHDVLSNQVLGGLPAGTGNLGEPRTVDFSAIVGDQFVTVPVQPCVAVQTGACCAGATCSVTTQVACSGPQTRFAGVGTVCNLQGNNTTPCCKADYNQSGTVTVQDIFDFLSAYFTSDPRADINASGTITVQDIFDFLSAYFLGCN
jgi:hypothetical protein